MTTDDFNLRRRYFGIINRCYNPKAPDYNRYGGKGVTMCQEWLDSFNLFKEWSLNNGYSSELEIDKDILCDKLGISPKIYSPSTCQWISKSENTAYMLKNRVYKEVAQYDLDGNLLHIYKTIAVASQQTGIDASNISRVCSNSRELAGNFQWKYVEDSKEISKYVPPIFGKKVIQIDKETGEVLAMFDSATIAAKALGKAKSSPITQVCTQYILPSGNSRSTAYGFKWSYADL